MKYVKTFESFKSDFDRQNKFNFNTESLNENLLDDIMDFFRNIWDHITEKAQDFVDFIGDKWNEFTSAVSQLTNKIVEAIGDKLGSVLKNIEKIFKKSASDLSFSDIKTGLENMTEVKSFESTNEYHNIGEFKKEDPLVQKILAIFENIFELNALSMGFLGSWLGKVFFGLAIAFPVHLLVSALAICIFSSIRNMLYKSAEKTKEKIKDPAFLRKKEELIDYMTGTDTGWKLGAIMSKKEPGFADITQDGELDTEMMTFKKEDILIFSGVSFYSSGEIKYVTTVRNLNGDILLEPFLSKDVEELNYSIRKTIESGIKQQPTKSHTPIDWKSKTYGDLGPINWAKKI
jgi:hypothetical protein